jgi:glyceraldehyde-3-phosphate dehydrogenase (NAD(P))
MNTLGPGSLYSERFGPDAQRVDPDLYVVTIVAKVPETIGHLHSSSIQLTREASKQDVVAAFKSPSRIALISRDQELSGINTVGINGHLIRQAACCESILSGAVLTPLIAEP